MIYQFSIINILYIYISLVFHSPLSHTKFLILAVKHSGSCNPHAWRILLANSPLLLVEIIISSNEHHNPKFQYFHGEYWLYAHDINYIYPFYPHFIPIFFDGEIPQFWPTAKVKTRLRGAAAWWAWAPRMGGCPRYGSHNSHTCTYIYIYIHIVILK